MEVATASPTSMKAYYFCELGYHRPVLTYHSGITALASFEPAIRCDHVTNVRTSRGRQRSAPSQNLFMEKRYTAQAISTCLVCGHNSVQSSATSQATTASSAEPPSQTGEYACPCGAPSDKELDHTSGISYAR